MRRALVVVALSALAMLGGTGTAPFAAAAGSSGAEGPFPAPDAVNAPPAAMTLVFLGTAARLDRAADSASRIRVTVSRLRACTGSRRWTGATVIGILSGR